MFRSETRSLNRLNYWSQSVNTRLTDRRFSLWLAGSLAAMLLVVFSGCGGVSQGAHNSNSTEPPTALSYSASPISWTQGVAMTASPTSAGGAVTSYRVTPPLPAGIVLNSSTGLISGTPLKPEAMTTYTVTASNSAGSTTAPLTITVNVAVPLSLKYSSPTAFYTVGVPIPENVPMITGGAPSEFTVTPSLPKGLLLSPGAPVAGPAGPTISAGVIVGTPQAATGAASYTVTATNSSGSATATLTITVLTAGANLAPAGLSYSAPAPVYAAGVAITPNKPVLRGPGQTPVTYSVSPALPAGLSMSQTGVLSGSPIGHFFRDCSSASHHLHLSRNGDELGGQYYRAAHHYHLQRAASRSEPRATNHSAGGHQFQLPVSGRGLCGHRSHRYLKVPPVEWMASGRPPAPVVSPDGNTLWS